MTDNAPDRIWAGKYHGTWWQSQPHHQMTEYIRADLYTSAITAALERLDASLFTNAEHQQAKDILRGALKEKLHDTTT